MWRFALFVLVGCRQVFGLDAPHTSADAAALQADAPTDAAAALAGIVARYPLDSVGNGRIPDAVGHYDLACSTCPTATQSQSGLEFNDLESAATSDLSLPAPFTVTAWVNLAARPDHSVILFESASSSVSVDQSGAPRIMILNAQTASVQALPMGAWTHLAIVIEAPTGGFFVGGTKTLEPNVPSTAVLSGLTLGDANNVKGPFLLDDVRVYNRALSQADISELVARGMGN